MTRFERLYRSYREYVVGALRWHRVPPADLDDAAQEVFLVLLRKLDEEVEPETIRPWLFQVARRVASNHRRSIHRHERKRSNEWREPPVQSPEHGVLRREGFELVTRFLDGLDPMTCRVFVLADIEGLRGVEIAERMGVPLHAVYPRLRKARKRLARLVDRREGRLRSLVPWHWFSGWRAHAGPLLAGALVLMVVNEPEPTLPGSAPARAGQVEQSAPVPAAMPAPVAVRETPVRPLVQPMVRPLVRPEPETLAPRRRARRIVRKPVLPPSPDPEPVPEVVPELIPEPVPDWSPVDAGTVLGPLLESEVAPVPRKQVQPGLRGSVVDAEGHGLANARVYCRRLEGARRRPCTTPSARTDRHGRFELGTPGAGEYELVAFREGTNATAGSDLYLELGPTGASVRLIAD